MANMVTGDNNKYQRVGVVGAGLVGLCTALSLQAKGYSVILFDRNKPGLMTSYGNAGVITPSSIIPLNIPGILKKLPKYLTNQDPGVRINPLFLPQVTPWLIKFMRGCHPDSVRKRVQALHQLISPALSVHLELAREADALSLIKQTGWAKLYREEKTFNACLAERELWDKYQLETELLKDKKLEHVVSGAADKYHSGILFKGAAYVDSPGRLVTAYRKLFLKKGGVFCQGEISDIHVYQEAELFYKVNVHKAGSYMFNQLVISAGPWSDDLLKPLGYNLPMVWERGYHQAFQLLDHQRVAMPFHDIEGAYVCTPMNDGVRILSGIEFDHRDRPASPVQLRKLLPCAREVLRLASPSEEPWLGRRPSMPDGLPVIGPASRHPGLWFAMGHGHIGLSTSGITGRWITNMISGKVTECYEAFSPKRFGL